MESSSCCEVDLRTNAGEVAIRLSSLDSFVGAAHDLLMIRVLSDYDRAQYTRKIIALAEIAHTTLTRAGIKLHTFTSCPPVLKPHKEAYFDLLRALEEFRRDFTDASLQERLARLLFPLNSSFVIHRGESSCRKSLHPSCAKLSRLEIPPGLRTYRLSAQRRRKVNPSTLMPPPDAFPSAIEEASRGRSRRRSNANRSWQSPEPEDNAEGGTSISYRPHNPSRRFGIFCTGKQPRAGHRRVAGYVPL